MHRRRHLQRKRHIHSSRLILSLLATLLLAPATAGAAERTFEPNDTMATAIGPLLGETTYASANDEPLESDEDGHNSRNEDVDWFFFNTSGAAHIRVAYVLDAVGDCFGPVVTLRDADGKALASAQPPPGVQANLETTVRKASTLYLELVPYHIGTCPETNSPYRFRIIPSAAPPEPTPDPTPTPTPTASPSPGTSPTATPTATATATATATPAPGGSTDDPPTLVALPGQTFVPPEPFKTPPAPGQSSPKLTLTKATFKKGRLRLRGTLAQSAPAKLITVTAFGERKGAPVVMRLRASADGATGWKAGKRVPKKLRRASKLTVSVAFSGNKAHVAQTLAPALVRRTR